MKAIAPPRLKRRKPKPPPKPKPKNALLAWWDRWRRSTRRAAARALPAPKKTATTTTMTTSRGLRVQLAPLLLVKASDGFWRGRPDPTLVLCAWAFDDVGRARTVLKAVVRFAAKAGVPDTAPADVDRLASTAVPRSERLLLCLALFEENGGDDIRALAAALERPEQLCFVDTAASVPVVKSAGEAVNDDALAVVSARGVLVDHAHASATRTDQWVGGAVVVVARGARDHRVSLQSADGRQDWTLSFTTTR
jgi:hypothetical protein